MMRSGNATSLPGPALRVAGLLLSLGAARAAIAGPAAAEKAAADALFQDGKKLMAQKRYDEACPKFEESQKLDPAGGTLLNLALCHELLGKTASAWVEFNDALVEARSDKRLDRQKLASVHIASLEPRLSRMTILVSAETSALAGLAVIHDGLAIHQATWGTAVPVDPGHHALSASAPGRKRWARDVVMASGEIKVVTVPALPFDADAAPPAATPRPEPPPAPLDPTGVNRVTIGGAAAGVGAAALGVGGFFGLRTLSKKKESDAACPTSTTCTPAGAAANDAAHSAATVADVGVALGLAALGVGAYLLLTAPSEAAAPPLSAAPPETSPGAGKTSLRTARVQASAGPGWLSLGVGGRW